MSDNLKRTTATKEPTMLIHDDLYKTHTILMAVPILNHNLRQFGERYKALKRIHGTTDEEAIEALRLLQSQHPDTSFIVRVQYSLT